MKKLVKLLMILIIIGAIIYVGMRLVKGGGQPNIPVPVDDFSGDEIGAENELWSRIIVKPIDANNKTQNIIIQCVYPEISGFYNENFQFDINTEILNNIQRYIKEMSFRVDQDTEYVELYKYVTSYEKLTSGKYLFLIVSQDYQTGGIRSNKWKDIYSIDASKERRIYLEELFKPGVKFESAIIDEITKQAENRHIELMNGEGLKKLSQKQAFYIKDNKLIIYFAPSMIAANIYGDLSFEMPFTLNADGTFSI